MADYRSDPFSIDAALLAAVRGFPHSYVMADPTAPSSVRVFAKSLYVLAAGWLLSVAWLWTAGVRQSLARTGHWPAGYDVGTLGGGVIPAVLLVFMALGLRRVSGRAAAWAERQEWHHAFWWSLVPNLLLLATVWVLIDAAR